MHSSCQQLSCPPCASPQLSACLLASGADAAGPNMRIVPRASPGVCRRRSQASGRRRALACSMHFGRISLTNSKFKSGCGRQHPRPDGCARSDADTAASAPTEQQPRRQRRSTGSRSTGAALHTAA
eukprot:360793-Chlamydomonas_euryale.AAC.8